MQLLGSEVLSSIRTAEGIQSQSQVPINRNNRVHIHSKVQGLPGTFTSTFSFEHHTLQLRGGGKDYKLLFEEKGIEALREQVIIQRSINGERREKKKKLKCKSSVGDRSSLPHPLPAFLPRVQ